MNFEQEFAVRLAAALEVATDEDEFPVRSIRFENDGTTIVILMDSGDEFTLAVSYTGFIVQQQDLSDDQCRWTSATRRLV